MDSDFLIEMEYAGLTGRLKRLSDSFMYSTKQFYRAQGLEIEPNWHVIFLLLKKHGNLTIMEIAEALKLSHPAIVQLVEKMKKKGYIDSLRDPEDQRKHRLTLSEKAKSKLPELETFWDAGNKALQEITNHRKIIFEELEILEKNLGEEDFRSRSERLLKKK